MHFVDEAGPQVVANGRDAATDPHVLAAGGPTRRIHRGEDPVGDRQTGYGVNIERVSTRKTEAQLTPSPRATVPKTAPGRN